MSADAASGAASPVPSIGNASELSRASTIEKDLDLLQIENAGSGADSGSDGDEEDELQQSHLDVTLEIAHPPLAMLLDIFRSQLPSDTCDAIASLIHRVRVLLRFAQYWHNLSALFSVLAACLMRPRPLSLVALHCNSLHRSPLSNYVASQVLSKKVQLTQPQFLRLMHLIAHDNVEELRRACQMGKQRLEASGWRPRPSDGLVWPSVESSPPASAMSAPPRHSSSNRSSSRSSSRASNSNGGRSTPDLASLRSKGIYKSAPTALARVRAQQLMALSSNDDCDDCHNRIAQLEL